MKSRISVIICSKNRVAALQKCLDAINTGEMVQVHGELILVNNASTDSTRQAMEAYRDKCPFPVIVIDESGRGLSRARNAGLAAAQGEIIIFTDDDCYLKPGYLITASHAFDSGEFQYYGGRILLHDPTDSLYGCSLREDFYLIPPYKYIRPGTVQGANLVLHRSVIDKVGLFDEMFGAGTPFRCEDIDYVGRASQAGFTGAHVPELVVYHHHGRKPDTPQLAKLKEDNMYAAGAYYAKFILMGSPKYLRRWIKRALHLNHWRRTVLEIRGGYAYVQARAKARAPQPAPQPSAPRVGKPGS